MNLCSEKFFNVLQLLQGTNIVQSVSLFNGTLRVIIMFKTDLLMQSHLLYRLQLKKDNFQVVPQSPLSPLKSSKNGMNFHKISKAQRTMICCNASSSCNFYEAR